MNENNLKELLDKQVKIYNQPSFLSDDPVSIPHLFSKKQDIEIAGFFAAIFSWGNRTTIINKSRELLHLMDNEPYEFCLNHDKAGLKRLVGFRHRTFNTTDLLYFVEFLKQHYSENSSLENAFVKTMHKNDDTVENGLVGFYNYFFSLTDYPERTKKHIASPAKNASCKRLNMFLRWMVRKDNQGVDFGIWKKISPAQLVIPMDVHVIKVARRLGILERKQTDWKAALALTYYLRTLDIKDPVKYDFALFGTGIKEKLRGPIL